MFALVFLCVWIKKPASLSFVIGFTFGSTVMPVFQNKHIPLCCAELYCNGSLKLYFIQCTAYSLLVLQNLCSLSERGFVQL